MKSTALFHFNWYFHYRLWRIHIPFYNEYGKEYLRCDINTHSFDIHWCINTKFYNYMYHNMQGQNTRKKVKSNKNHLTLHSLPSVFLFFSLFIQQKSPLTIKQIPSVQMFHFKNWIFQCTSVIQISNTWIQQTPATFQNIHTENN